MTINAVKNVGSPDPFHAAFRQSVNPRPVHLRFRQSVNSRPVHAGLRQRLDPHPIHTGFRKSIDPRPVHLRLRQRLHAGPVHAGFRERVYAGPVDIGGGKGFDPAPVHLGLGQRGNAGPVDAGRGERFDAAPVDALHRHFFKILPVHALRGHRADIRPVNALFGDAAKVRPVHALFGDHREIRPIDAGNAELLPANPRLRKHPEIFPVDAAARTHRTDVVPVRLAGISQNSRDLTRHGSAGHMNPHRGLDRIDVVPVHPGIKGVGGVLDVAHVRPVDRGGLRADRRERAAHHRRVVGEIAGESGAIVGDRHVGEVGVGAARGRDPAVTENAVVHHFVKHGSGHGIAVAVHDRHGNIRTAERGVRNDRPLRLEPAVDAVNARVIRQFGFHGITDAGADAEGIGNRRNGPRRVKRGARLDRVKIARQIERKRLAGVIRDAGDRSLGFGSGKRSARGVVQKRQRHGLCRIGPAGDNIPVGVHDLNHHVKNLARHTVRRLGREHQPRRRLVGLAFDIRVAAVAAAVPGFGFPNAFARSAPAAATAVGVSRVAER